MKKYAYTLALNREYAEAVRGHAFILRCSPGTYPFQRAYAHKLTLKPFAALTYLQDAYGNELFSGTIDKSHKNFTFSASGFVLSSKYIIHEPEDPMYRYPTAATRPSGGMRQLLASAEFPEDDWERAQALCGLTYRLITAVPSSKNVTAADTLAAGTGTARDFAQLLVALCRLSGIGARCVSGLAVGIPTVHAWTEVYCGGVWRALDPSCGNAVEEGYLKFAHGADYDGCTILRDCSTPDAQLASEYLQVSVTEHVARVRDTVPHE